MLSDIQHLIIINLLKIFSDLQNYFYTVSIIHLEDIRRIQLWRQVTILHVDIVIGRIKNIIPVF